MASSQETRDALMFWALVLITGFFCVFIGRTVTEFPPLYLMAGMIGLIIGFVSFLFPKIGLDIVVFSMIFSPKVEGMQISNVGYHSAVIFKLNDFLLGVILVAWVARTAVFKGTAFLQRTSLNLPIIAMATVYVVATLFAIMRGDLLSAARPALYVLKYLEYFMLFFMTVNIVQTREDVSRYLKYGLMTALAVTAFAFTEMSQGERLNAPFDDPINTKVAIRDNEANTFGGYYLVVFAMLLAGYSQTIGTESWICLLSMFFMLTPFLLTQSRSSYIGFMGQVLFHLFATRKRQLALVFGVGAGLFLATLVPGIRKTVVDRILYTFSGQSGETVVVGGTSIALEGSAAARVQSWRYILTQRFPLHPIVGAGVTGVGMVDVYYPRVIGETGLLGLVCFLWLIQRCWRCAWRVFHDAVVDLDRFVGLGALTAIVGLLIHSLGANTFIIVRIMEPFWFIMALIARLYVLEPEPADRPELAAATAA